MRIMTSGFLKAVSHFLVPAIPLFSLTFSLAPVPVQAQAAGLRVSGTLFVGTLSDNPNSALSEVELPDATVTLTDTLAEPGKSVVDTTTTSLDGRFSLTAAPGRTYELCWEVQGQKGCATRVKVDKFPVFAGRVRAGLKGPLVFGTVLTGDARPCWVQDAFFGLDVSTKIRGGGQSTRANVQGEYVLAVPANATFRVQAGCELSEAGQTVTATGLLQRVDLNLGNHAPRITSLAATNGTRFLTRAQMGETLKMLTTSRELDGDPVTYDWKLIDAQNGTLTGSATDSEEWQLPNLDGRHSLYVMAQDGKGGFAFKRFGMDVGVNTIDVSGIAIDAASGQPVPKATVTLGGATTQTSDTGWFALSTAPQPDDRYVLNIRHKDFALMSRILDRSSAGNTYPLIRAQVTTHRGDQDINIEDTRSFGACGDQGQGGEKPVKRLVPATFYVEETDPKPDGAQEIRKYLEAQRDCNRRGVRIGIPARSLVDETGKVWTGLVHASVATVNPAIRSLPGDYQAIDAAGNRVEMQSFGAVYAEFTDVSGRKLQLAPGATAEIMTPVSPYALAAAPPTIAQWSYDEATGFWREEAQGQLQATPDGPRYVGKTEHFSTINMDVAGNDPAKATCVRVEIDSAFSAWSNLTLRAYVSYNGDSVQVKETALDNSQYHAIYRIPFGNTFPPNTLRLELRGTLSGQQLVLLDNIINTDARPKMTGTNLWPPYPYTECGVPILLTPAPGVVPAYGDLDGTGRPSFLVGPYGDFNPPDGAQQVVDYYNAIDPGGNKTTLGDWWQANGFGPDGLGAGNSTYINQAYLNHNDLGFGRDMHCAKNGANLACYVTNYGLPDQNPANADDAANKKPATRGATVTMEWNAAAPAAERVQFYVFGGGVGGSGRINFADLDGFGPKPVPFLCEVCHGGGPALNAAHKVDNARFREFDLPSFRYSGNRSWDYGQATLNATELGNFAKLNQMVRDSTVGQPIGSLINAWYPGGFGGSPAPVLPTPPSGWSGHASEYHNVYGKACRTCHIARDAGNPNAFFVFNSFGNLQGTGYAVCGSGSPKRRFMPNAVVTYKNFWADSLRVQAYETIVGAAAGSCND
jgi:hypothetical protein